MATVKDTSFIDIETSKTLSVLKARTVTAIREILLQTQPKANYKELLQLVLLFLGEATVADIPLGRPSALYRGKAKGNVTSALYRAR